ncbi:hypothetical protein DWQ65_08450 [Treponema phagedenis]|nr:hypothetical protein DWQ65_08450 [Treponema phagedenis]
MKTTAAINIEVFKLAGEVKTGMSTLRPCCWRRAFFAYASPRSCVPLTPAPEECKFQNGHGRPWFHADGLVFATDGKN